MSLKGRHLLDHHNQFLFMQRLRLYHLHLQEAQWARDEQSCPHADFKAAHSDIYCLPTLQHLRSRGLRQYAQIGVDLKTLSLRLVVEQDAENGVRVTGLLRPTYKTLRALILPCT